MKRWVGVVLGAVAMVAVAAPSLAGEPPDAVAETPAGKQEGNLTEFCWSSHEPPFVAEFCVNTVDWEGPFPRKTLQTEPAELVEVALGKPEPPSSVRVRYWTRSGWTPMGPEAKGRFKAIPATVAHAIGGDGLHWVASFEMPPVERALIEVRVEWEFDVQCAGCGQTQWGEWLFHLKG